MNFTWNIRSENGAVRVSVLDNRGELVRQSDSALTCAQVSRILRKTRRHVYRYVEHGLLDPLGKFFDEWLFDAGQVARLRKTLALGRIPLRRPSLPARCWAFFPEYNPEAMNPWTNAPLIITRILDTGTRRDWKWILRQYPRSVVCAVVREHGRRLMSERSLHFWTWLLDVERRPSNPRNRPSRGGLLTGADRWEGIPIASAADIGAMKLSALVGRGSRKDFLDLYILTTRVMPLGDLIRKAQKKFPAAADFTAQCLRALVYFKDAETEDPPVLLEPVSWRDVRAHFETEARALSRSFMKS